MFQAPSPYPAQHNLDDATVFKMTHVTPQHEPRAATHASGAPPLPGLTTREQDVFNTLRMKIMTASMTNPTAQPPAPPSATPQTNSDVERQLQLLEILARLLGTVQQYSGQQQHQQSPGQQQQQHQQSPGQQAPTTSRATKPCDFPMFYILLGFIGVLLAVVAILLVIAIRRALGGKTQTTKKRSRRGGTRGMAGSDWVETLKKSVRGFDE
jgi:hypothetical protein